jgi:hypothetical protein
VFSAAIVGQDMDFGPLPSWHMGQKNIPVNNTETASCSKI